MCEEMKTLVSRFGEYLRRSEQQLRCFHRCQSQVEGWFKGELLNFLDREKREVRLHDFGREESVNGGRIDIKLIFDESSPPSWVELKHWIRTQNNTDWYHNNWYFKTANHSSCVKPVVENMLNICGDGDKFMLVLCTDKPDLRDWTNGVEAFNNNGVNGHVESLTIPTDYPDYFFLGLLHVSD